MASAGPGSKPDLVLLNREHIIIALLELTCSLSGSAVRVNQQKLNTYTQLAINLEEKGYTVFLVPFEVISSGPITNMSKTTIRNTLQQFNIRVNIRVEFVCELSQDCTFVHHESVLHLLQKRMGQPPTPRSLTCIDPSTLQTPLPGVDCSPIRRWSSTMGITL